MVENREKYYIEGVGVREGFIRLYYIILYLYKVLPLGVASLSLCGAPLSVSPWPLSAPDGLSARHSGLPRGLLSY